MIYIWSQQKLERKLKSTLLRSLHYNPSPLGPLRLLTRWRTGLINGRPAARAHTARAAWSCACHTHPSESGSRLGEATATHDPPMAEERLEAAAADEYTQDGTVDLHGHPVLRSKRGGWKACGFVVGTQAASYPIYHESLCSCHGLCFRAPQS
jgi:hypothetical protein